MNKQSGSKEKEKEKCPIHVELSNVYDIDNVERHEPIPNH
jgi:hypothetical protein